MENNSSLSHALTDVVAAVFGKLQLVAQIVHVFLRGPYKTDAFQVLHDLPLAPAVDPFKQVHLLPQDFRLRIHYANYGNLKNKGNNAKNVKQSNAFQRSLNTDRFLVHEKNFHSRARFANHLINVQSHRE